MLYYSFKDYEGFKEVFGKRVTNNGKTVRQNKILLEFAKSKQAHKWCKRNRIDFYGITCLTDLYQMIVKQLGKSLYYHYQNFQIMGIQFYSSLYATDVYNGICEDGTSPQGFVRYHNLKDDNGSRYYKKRCSRLFKDILQEFGMAENLPEQVCRWFEENITERWKAYAEQHKDDYTLQYDEDFEFIYDSDNYFDGSDFHSCMTDDPYWRFYRDCVDAKAASLLSKNGKVLARAVVFTNVKEEGSDKIWRLCERQYSVNESEKYKRMLVDQLIQAKLIDGYKRIGASCHSSHAFEDIHECSLADKTFYIDCRLDSGYEYVSYQDSFKYFDYENQIAYNSERDGCVCELTVTGGEIEISYDELNGRYCNSVTNVMYHGDYYNVDSDTLDDYVELNGYYYHEDDIVYCPQCEGDMLNPEYYESRLYYSELLDKYFCCSNCRYKAEREYKEENWHYSEWDDEYCEKESDIKTMMRWDESDNEYVSYTIYAESLKWLVNNDRVLKYEGKYYYNWNHGTGLPFGVEIEKVLETEEIEAAK